jgi:hypothetical protein
LEQGESHLRKWPGYRNIKICSSSTHPQIEYEEACKEADELVQRAQDERQWRKSASDLRPMQDMAELPIMSEIKYLIP